jgi:hypothetical protein
MSENDPIDMYLNEFARQSAGRNRRARRALLEIEDHLRERAAALCRQGMEPAKAAAAAIAQFGAASEILRQFELHAPMESEVPIMSRHLLTVVAAITSAFAVLLFTFAWFDDAAASTLAAKVALAVITIAYNGLLISHLWLSDSRSVWRGWLVFCGGLALIAAGSAGVVWTAHLGQVTGDWESYGFLAAGTLVLEGLLAAVWVMWQEGSDARVDSIGCA